MKKEMKETIILLIISIILSFIYDFLVSNVFNVYQISSMDRKIVVTAIIFFIGLHTIFGFKKLYGFIIEHRYKIAGALIICLTVLNYSGSSMGALGKWILEEDKNNTIFGTYRMIRSDEYGVETPLAISQYLNDFGYTNSNLRGISTDVFSVLHIPVKDIVSVGKIFNIGYYFLNSGMALSLFWNLKLFALILVSFELCMILTNRNKYLSLIGSVIISFSGAVQWWFMADILFFGQLIIVLIDKFLTTDKFKIKILCALSIAISIVSYVFTFYPAWMVSLGYVFLALFIWVILKNRKTYKINLKDVLLILIVIAIVFSLVLRYYSLSKETINIMSNTAYPGERVETGGGGIGYLFSYLYNFLLPFITTSDNCSFASIISVFPIPLIMGLIYLYKKGKHIEFLFPIVLVTVLETIYCISGFPEVVSKITLLSYVSTERCAISVALANVYIFLYMLANIDEEILDMKRTTTVALVAMCIVTFVPLPEAFTDRRFIYLFSGILCMISFLLLNYTDSRYKKVFLVLVVGLTLIGGVTVNPITKGTSIITDSNFAKKIQEVVCQDEEGIWVSEGMSMVISNYMVANGARTLNSTNIYPNKEFYKTILGEEELEKNDEIWNRYAHIELILDTQNYIELQDKDKIKLHITGDKVKELNIKYVVSYNNINYLENMGLNLNILYENEIEEAKVIEGREITGIYIYELIN